MTTSAWRQMCTTICSIVHRVASAVAERERFHERRPAVDEHEDHDLERQGHRRRRYHHHAHRHENVRDHEVDDEKRDEDEEAGDERLAQLARYERGNEYGEVARLRARGAVSA